MLNNPETAVAYATGCTLEASAPGTVDLGGLRAVAVATQRAVLNDIITKAEGLSEPRTADWVTDYAAMNGVQL